MDHIIPYRADLAVFFRDLNLEWLEHYFHVEPHDRDLLEWSQEMIIDKGGFIFFYEHEGKVLGTFALIKQRAEVYELGKMAVDFDSRGIGVGQKMMEYCIRFAKSKGWSKLLLYSNTKLQNSIHIYKKFGFIEVPLEKDNPYGRGNIKMELKL